MEASAAGITQEQVSAWMDMYFAEVRECIGSLEKVPRLGKLFTDDFEFVYYTPPATAEFTGARTSREGLLKEMIHPGLKEIIEPYYYTFNMEKLIVCARFNDRTVDEETGRDIVPPFQASAHYTLVPAEDTGLKIKQIEYWTENQLPENIAITQAAWFKNSRPAFENIIHEWLKARY
ncbi:MAG TPA: hypothetical protein VJP78_03500 [Thermoleophilia bacterium]|nr:hypothetical protein [Thermoleophilia bacterium]